MRRPIFVGDKELNEAHRRVGAIVSACAELEHAVAYLQWQLTAFSFDSINPMISQSDRQKALRTQREAWNKYARLDTRLNLATKAFDAEPVMSRAEGDQPLNSPLLKSCFDQLRSAETTMTGMAN
ncbi:MAG: hypothetical protein WB760_09085 [Xanthobacteraceae bacterium]